MSKTAIETNAVEVWNAFEKFETKEMKKAITSGLRSAANELRKEVRKSLKSSIPSSTKKNSKYNDTLAQGVRTTKVKEKGSFFYTYTTIASNRKTGSGSFRLHILEGGTGLRKTKNGYNRGSVKQYNFFQNAENSFKPRAAEIIRKKTDEAVMKINKKKIQ